MSSSIRPRPLFAIAQVVMIRSRIDPSRNTDRTLIIERQWFEGDIEQSDAQGWLAGWHYVVSSHIDAWAVEASLRPLPDPAGCSWSELKAELNRSPVYTSDSSLSNP